jgi:hypothetical protein
VVAREARYGLLFQRRMWWLSGLDLDWGLVSVEMKTWAVLGVVGLLGTRSASGIGKGRSTCLI